MHYGKTLKAMALLLTILVSIWTLGGCSTIHVERVTPANDAELKGFRYYLPRPFVAVKAPFPIDGGDFFVTGTVDSADNVLRIEQNAIPEQIRNQFQVESENATQLNLPWSRVQQSIAVAENDNNDNDNDNDDNDNDNDDNDNDNDDNDNDDNNESEGGGASVASTLDPATSPLIAINDVFDIIYLPDFSEKYSVHAKPRLQKASADLKLKHGWMLEHVTTEVDNTQIAEFIFSNINKFTDLAAAIGKAKFLPAAPAPPGPKPEPEPEAEPVGPAEALRETDRAIPVLLRIRYMVEALPGLYPVLKPGEAHTETSNASQLRIPALPFTVNAYNTRYSIVIERVVVTPDSANQVNENSQDR